MPPTVAALYVLTDGPYAGREDVDLWPEERDARLYAGPWPVVAHPPCARWGRYYSGGPMLARTPRAKKGGDDAGCFAAALEAVRGWGGVLEHPEGSHAWRFFKLPKPPRAGGWVRGICGGWSCCVEQGHYGHTARKATWLYLCGVYELPDLAWGSSAGQKKMEEGFHTNAERRAARAAGVVAPKRITDRERMLTPEPFAELLLDIARKCRAD